MALLGGSTSFARYLVIADQKPDDVFNHVLTGLKENTMPEMPGDADDLLVGWMPLESPYVGKFDTHTFMYGTDMVFCFRIDKKKITASVLKRELEIEVDKRKKKTGRSFLSKNEKSEIKEMVTDKLLAQAPRTTDIYEVSWNTETMELLIFASAKSVKELFETMFIKSFNMKPVSMFPFSQAHFKMGSLTRDQHDKLGTLEPLGVR